MHSLENQEVTVQKVMLGRGPAGSAFRLSNLAPHQLPSFTPTTRSHLSHARSYRGRWHEAMSNHGAVPGRVVNGGLDAGCPWRRTPQTRRQSCSTRTANPMPLSSCLAQQPPARIRAGRLDALNHRCGRRRSTIPGSPVGAIVWLGLCLPAV